MEQSTPSSVSGDNGRAAKRQSDEQCYGKAEYDKRERDRRPHADLQGDRFAADGVYAVMVLECDSHIPHVLEQQMAVMPGIRKVTCLNIDEPEECEEG